MSRERVVVATDRKPGYFDLGSAAQPYNTISHIWR
jgi:hypothetical protein